MTTVSRFERVARSIYVTAQDYNFFKSRELKPQGKVDRALNYVLGFNSHDERLVYLHLQMSGQLAIKGQTLQGAWTSLGLDRGIQSGRDYIFASEGENFDRILADKEIKPLREWYEWKSFFHFNVARYLNVSPFKPSARFEINIPPKVSNFGLFSKFKTDEVLVRAIKNGQIDTTIFYRPMPSGLVHTRGLI